MDTPHQSLFGKIALALSGGGFRAAAFSLGSLSYLHSVKLTNGDESQTLLDRVCFLSSASGGSITSVLYTYYRKNGKSFDEFFKKLYELMNGEKLLEDALKILGDDKEWSGKSLKHRNLINAFSKVYDRNIFDGATFSTFWKSPKLNPTEVCVNATEFYKGLWFRFQNDGYIGNNYVRFDYDKLKTVHKIKLGDILAASSCFPSGFEPIVFPTDFTYEGLSADDLKESLYVEDYDGRPVKGEVIIPLMDGGITDNQGLYSAMLADERKMKNQEKVFDLIIVCDVASYFMDNYKPIEQQSAKGFRSLSFYSIQNRLSGFTRTDVIVLLLIMLSVLLIYAGEGFATAGYLVLSPSVLFGLIFQWIKFKIKKITNPYMLIRETLNVGENFSDGIINLLVRYLKKTRFNVLEQMIKNRISSVVTMVSDINLKHTRRLIYDKFYDQPVWDNKRVANFIYELSEINHIKRRSKILTSALREEDKLTLLDIDTLVPIAEAARKMGTTLWFDEDDTKKELLKNIIACGQFTMCGNLLEYLATLEADEKYYASLDEPSKEEIKDLKKQLVDDWNAFKSDPYWLLPN